MMTGIRTGKREMETVQVRKMRRRESGGLEEVGKSNKQPVRKMTRRRIK